MADLIKNLVKTQQGKKYERSRNSWSLNLKFGWFCILGKRSLWTRKNKIRSQFNLYLTYRVINNCSMFQGHAMALSTILFLTQDCRKYVHSTAINTMYLPLLLPFLYLEKMKGNNRAQSELSGLIKFKSKFSLPVLSFKRTKSDLSARVVFLPPLQIDQIFFWVSSFIVFVSGHSDVKQSRYR